MQTILTVCKSWTIFQYTAHIMLPIFLNLLIKKEKSNMLFTQKKGIRMQCKQRNKNNCGLVMPNKKMFRKQLHVQFLYVLPYAIQQHDMECIQYLRQAIGCINKIMVKFKCRHVFICLLPYNTLLLCLLLVQC